MNDNQLRELAEQKVQFRRQFYVFVIVNAFLWLIWLVECFRHGFVFPWPIYPTIGWGIGLAFQYFTKLSKGKKEEAVEKEYQKLKKMDKK